MGNQSRIAGFAGAIALTLLAAPACAADINKSIKISAGSETGGQSSVNGSITVDEGAVINGSLSTVNGSIRVEENVRLDDAETVNGTIRIASGSSAEDVSSVNGAIRLGENVTIDGEIDVVNGKITIDNGSKVADSVSNVNGEIEISGSEIGGDLTTVNGDVLLVDGSTLAGNLVIEKPGGWGWKNNRNPPKVIIGENSRVVGRIMLEREVELFISESAEVGGVTGELSMDDAVRFSGSRP